MSNIELISETACFGGVQQFYKHNSRETRGSMKFGVYLPPLSATFKVPVLYYLAGLTCTEETFAIKAHAQAMAAELGLMLVTPDTSPREPRIPGDAESWDFGQAASFYVDATQAPWSANYRMYSYITRELPEVVAGCLPSLTDAVGIFGHSMGGHGALTIALRNPEQYRSVSAFAPIVAPSQTPWGQKAFANYLGPDKNVWREHDASALVARKAFPGQILIDQGGADPFLNTQLIPETFSVAAALSGQQVSLRIHTAYDHSYYFIQSFMTDHLRHHAAILKR
jgi:S-formylglutathione hydrolase